MSRILKTIWSKSDKKPKRNSETMISIPIQREIDLKPFDIDLKTIWKYDNEELCGYILKYEEFIKELTKKYQDMSEEYPMLKEKCILDERERKRLTEELNQYKIQCENSKGFIQQRNNNGAHSQKSLSNSIVRAQGASQQSADFKKCNLDSSSILKKMIAPIKILEHPFVSELKSGFKWIIENIQEILNRFDKLEKRNFLQELNDNKEEENKSVITGEYYVIEAEVRKTMIDDAQRIQEIIQSCSVGFDSFLQNIQERNKRQMNQEILIPLEAENSKQSDEINLDYQSKLAELKMQTNEQAKVIEDLISQNLVLENLNVEMEDQLSALNCNLSDLKHKLERSERDLQNSKELEESLRSKLTIATDEGDRKSQELSGYVSRIDTLNKIISDLEKSKANLNEEIKMLKEELKKTFNGEEQNQSEAQVEIANLKASVHSMRDQIEQLQTAVSAKESKLLDFENKLIQERLKVDQIKRDLVKAEENFKQAKNDLNDQTIKNHNVLKTLENVENELLDTKRKYRESKRDLKKAEVQITKAQNQLQDEQTQRAKLEQTLSEQKTDSTKLDETFGSPKFGDDELTMRGMSREIRDLNEKIELLTTENTELKDQNKNITKLLKEERSEIELLKEKREAGVKEIKRLNAMIDTVKNGKSKSSQSMSENDAAHLKVISNVKKSLEALYKQFIVSIQYEKALDPNHVNGAKSLRNVAQGLIPSDDIVRLEKSLNDMILFVREYLETIQ